MINKMENQSVYSPPNSQVIDKTNIIPLSSDGNRVVAQIETQWPTRCYQCNAVAIAGEPRRLQYFPRWLIMLFLPCFFLIPFLGSVTSLMVISGAVFVIYITLSYVFTRQLLVNLPVCETHRMSDKPFLTILWFKNSFLRQTMTVVRYQDGLFWIRGTGQAFRDSLPPFN